MINKRLFRSALHEHADPAQRVLGAAELPPDCAELARLLSADPAAEVRAAAARRCTDVAVLAAAWETEIDPAVRADLAWALPTVLSATQDGAAAAALLQADRCTDAIRAEVARRTQDADLRRIAIDGIRDEEPLIELAQAGDHAETRKAAAERVQTLEGLRKLADATRNKDRGVSRLARQRIDALTNRAGQTDEADAILTLVETLTNTPGPILTGVVELDKRWQALDIGGDADRRARWEVARQTLQTRFAREHDDQRTRTRFERKS
ncbi:MAG: hypothetical protein GZ089_10275, partial [Aromatoleum sp.]|nr:hypothetical protein [Aromatoleum sp.]